MRREVTESPSYWRGIRGRGLEGVEKEVIIATR
jgi:hypothetical protein